MNHTGRIAEPIYAYPCSCGMLHITRRASWNGVGNHLVFQPVSPELQVEFMDDEARAIYEQRDEHERAEAARVEFRKLPDPMPTAQSYANRPRGLRRGAN